MAVETERHAEHAAGHGEATGIWSWITTVDHKRIAIMYFTTSVIFFMVAGAQAVLMRIQLFRPENDFLAADTFNQMFTMHGTSMVFLVAMPMAVAFFNFVVPLQIGARDVAFPRLNALSYWIYLFGGLYLYSSYLFGAAPNAAWTGYATLTLPPYSPGLNLDFWFIGLSIIGISSIMGGVNFITTIINMRAPGMKLMRMPLFTWMTLVTSFLLVTAIPVISVALIFLGFDRVFGATFFDPTRGGDPVFWQHLFWLFGHPEVYILVLPAFGAISDIIPAFSKKPLFGYPIVVYAGILIGFIGWGVWSHHMFTVGLGPIADSFFVASTMIIAIPTGVKIFNWLGTMWGGSIRFTTAMLFSVGLVAVFTVGGLSGIMHAAAPVNLQQHDTYFVVAHFHYVIVGGSMMGLWAALYFWFPKAIGRYLDETLGKWHFWTTMIGLNLTFFPMHFSGLYGMPRRIFTYPEGLGLEIWNQLSTVGAVIFGISGLIMAWNLVRSHRAGEPAPPDPWRAHSLEWALPSPPHHYNFPNIPTVRSREPLWDDEERREVEAATMAEPEAEPHMPTPSYWPICLAAAITLSWGLVMTGVWWVIALGIIPTAICVFMWAFEPAFPEGSTH